MYSYIQYSCSSHTSSICSQTQTFCLQYLVLKLSFFCSNLRFREKLQRQYSEFCYIPYCSPSVVILHNHSTFVNTKNPTLVHCGLHFRLYSHLTSFSTMSFFSSRFGVIFFYSLIDITPCVSLRVCVCVCVQKEKRNIYLSAKIWEIYSQIIKEYQKSL